MKTVKTMKTSAIDPWSNGTNVQNVCEDPTNDRRFEDSFVNEVSDSLRLSDSEQYLAKLYSRLKHVKGGQSKKDLVDSLSNVKEDYLARYITNGPRYENEEESLLATNPLVRHIAPHLQALTTSELVHLLKADVLQNATDEQNGQNDHATRVETEEIKIESSKIESSKEENGNTESVEVNQEENQPTIIKENSNEEQ